MVIRFKTYCWMFHFSLSSCYLFLKLKKISFTIFNAPLCNYMPYMLSLWVIWDHIIISISIKSRVVALYVRFEILVSAGISCSARSRNFIFWASWLGVWLYLFLIVLAILNPGTFDKTLQKQDSPYLAPKWSIVGNSLSICWSKNK